MKYALCVLGILVLNPLGVFGQVERLKEERDECSISYHLVHPLHHIDSTSKEPHFEVQADISGKEIHHVSAWVDVTTFDSGNSNRDSHAMEVIDALTYPEARFESTEIVERGDSLRIQGELTFHGVKKGIEALGTAAWTNKRLDVKGSFELSLTAFSVDRPTLLLIPVEDRLSFSFVAVFSLH
jgi:hypothetical protein